MNRTLQKTVATLANRLSDEEQLLLADTLLELAEKQILLGELKAADSDDSRLSLEETFSELKTYLRTAHGVPC